MFDKSNKKSVSSPVQIKLRVAFSGWMVERFYSNKPSIKGNHYLFFIKFSIQNIHIHCPNNVFQRG